ncbi:MAG: hypothetical protein GQ558_07665, partial [Thermoplasmata archaeon]|nr:hypothetical protein [Thermoplasmata archaeon]
MGLHQGPDPYDRQLCQGSLQRPGEDIHPPRPRGSGDRLRHPRRERGSVTLAVVRVRGIINVKNDIRDTLTMLGLGRVNHCVLIDETPQYMGMVRKVRDYVTYGPIDAETAALLLKERGRLEGRKPLDESIIKEMGEFKSFDDMGKAIAEGQLNWS